MLVPGMSAPTADDLLTVGEVGTHQPGLGGPPPVQLRQLPPLPLGQRPHGGVGAQQLQGLDPVVVEARPALYDVAARPVVQCDRQSGVPEAEPQFVALGVVPLEGPFRAAALGCAHGQGGACEAGAALDGVLLASVERGLEGGAGRHRAGGELLGVGECDRGAPVQVEQLVVLGEMDGVTARGARQHPRTAVLGDLQHQVPHRFEQVHSSSNIINGPGPARQRLWTTQSLWNRCRIVGSVPAGEPRRRAEWEESS